MATSGVETVHFLRVLKIRSYLLLENSFISADPKDVINLLSSRVS